MLLPVKPEWSGLKRLLMFKASAPKVKQYGGIPVFIDNAFYTGSGSRDSFVTNPDYFIAGIFDSGSSGSKEYTYSYSLKPSEWIHLRTYDDLDGPCIDYWGVSAVASSLPQTRTVTMSGRYILVPIYKPMAEDMWMHDDTNNVYLYKGTNVT